MVPKNLFTGEQWRNRYRKQTDLWAWEKGEEDEMVGWYHRLNGHEFEQTQGDGEGQGSLACCSPWGHKESGMTE